MEVLLPQEMLLGVWSIMVMVKVILVVPPLLFAQTVYVVSGEVTVASPMMWPLLKVIPEGSIGLILQETGAPPVHDGIRFTVSTFHTKVKSETPYVNIETGTSLIWSSIRVEVLPPLLLAQIKCVLLEWMTDD